MRTKDILLKNAKPWRATSMTCYYYSKIGHLVKEYRSQKETQVHNLDHKGKRNIVEKEEVRKEFNKIWTRKEDENKEVKFEEVENSPISI